MHITPDDAAALAATIDVLDLAERIGRRAVEVIADLHNAQDHDLEQLTVEAALSNVHAVLRGFSGSEDPTSAQAPDLTLRWVATLAQRGISVSAIPRCYVVGMGMCDAALREAVYLLSVPEDVKWKLTNVALDYLYEYCEKITGDLVDHYQRERALWVRGADSVQAELVLAILAGRPVDLHATSAALGYNLDRPHLALIVWVDPRDPDQPPLQALKRAAGQLASQLKGMELLVVPAGSAMVWAWTSGPALTDQLPDALSIDSPLFATVGGLSQGVDGFVRSHRQAKEARRMVGMFAPAAKTVTHHRDVALTALLTNDLSAAGEFVKQELGELCADTERNRRLRSTLVVYFQENMSWSRTAERLGVHQNTVMYRVQQAKDLLSCSLIDRRLELEVALRLADASANLRAGGPAGAGQPDLDIC
ncbi:hypothetical protein BH11ACT7_BH11ACT7_19590 [soil metagenome]